MSAKFSNVNEDLLVKYLLGEANEAERQEVTDWINSSNRNKKIFDDIKKIWDESKKIEATSNVDVEEAWTKFQERRQNAESGTTKAIEFPTKKFNWMRAASVAALIGAGVMAYTFSVSNSGKLMAVNSGNAVLIDTLPDGSVVTLNKNSSITYNSKLNGNARSVKLQGEAFFNVTPDKEHPFVIDVNGSTVTVVGTSFNIKSTEDKTEVIVETGIVDVSKNSNSVTLNPKEKATILLNSDGPVKENSQDELYNYYKTKKFVCNNTPISRLVEVLNDAYGAQIVIEGNSIGYLPMNTTFDMGSLQEALATISRTYPQVDIIEKGGKYILQ